MFELSSNIIKYTLKLFFCELLKFEPEYEKPVFGVSNQVLQKLLKLARYLKFCIRSTAEEIRCERGVFQKYAEKSYNLTSAA